jgi:hypothetical protein
MALNLQMGDIYVSIASSPYERMSSEELYLLKRLRKYNSGFYKGLVDVALIMRYLILAEQLHEGYDALILQGE